MELTLESAFSNGGMLGHLSYVLLIVSMMSRKMFWLRVGVIGSALAGIAYAIFVLTDPVIMFWETLLLAVNLYQLVRIIMAERGATFTAEENKMIGKVLHDLTPLEARTLLDKGFWVSRESGLELIREGNAVDHLYYLADGTAEVRARGKVVGDCRTGDLIGEGTILTSDTASGTVVLSKDSRLWCIPAPVLRKHLDDNSNVRTILDRRIGDALKSKLRASNVALSAAGGVKGT